MARFVRLRTTFIVLFERLSDSPTLLWATSISSAVAIGGADYLTGAELRVFPMYYAPISLLAWHAGRSAALTLAVLCALLWVASNYFAGLVFSHPGIWIANALMQAMSFATVGVLIAMLRGALRRARALSRTDQLTSVSNSRAFYEDARRVIAVCRRQRRPLTLAYIDLDHFKSVNDTHGHQAGDALLRRVAGVLSTSVRPGDLVARLGGDEFVVLLPEAGPQDAAVALERLRTVVANALESSSTHVTGSIGGVTFVTPPDEVEAMVRTADALMYQAKAMGRNRVCHEVVAAMTATDTREHSPAVHHIPARARRGSARNEAMNERDRDSG